MFAKFLITVLVASGLSAGAFAQGQQGTKIVSPVGLCWTGPLSDSYILTNYQLFQYSKTNKDKMYMAITEASQMAHNNQWYTDKIRGEVAKDTSDNTIFEKLQNAFNKIDKDDWSSSTSDEAFDGDTYFQSSFSRNQGFSNIVLSQKTKNTISSTITLSASEILNRRDGEMLDLFYNENLSMVSSMMKTSTIMEVAPDLLALRYLESGYMTYYVEHMKRLVRNACHPYRYVEQNEDSRKRQGNDKDSAQKNTEEQEQEQEQEPKAKSSGQSKGR